METESMGDLDLTDSEVAAYRAIAGGRTAGDDAAIRRLVSLGLVEQGAGREVALDPRIAARELLAEQRRILGEALARIDRIPELEALAEHYDPARLYGGPASELLPTKELMNNHIGDVLAEATGQLLTCQPGEPDDRDPDVQREGIRRSRALLARGVACRFLYSAVALEHDDTCDYVEGVLSAGGEVRVGRDLPPRMVLTGRNLFVDNHVVPAEPNAGWHVKDVASVAYARDVFNAHWERATPWQEASRTLSEVVTSVRQRAILHAMEAVDSQAKVAARVEISEREVSRQLSLLRARVGRDNNNQLLIWWATSKDRTLP